MVDSSAPFLDSFELHGITDSGPCLNGRYISYRSRVNYDEPCG